jgi:hypothetical protein
MASWQSETWALGLSEVASRPQLRVIQNSKQLLSSWQRMMLHTCCWQAVLLPLPCLKATDREPEHGACTENKRAQFTCSATSGHSLLGLQATVACRIALPLAAVAATQQH